MTLIELLGQELIENINNECSFYCTQDTIFRRGQYDCFVKDMYIEKNKKGDPMFVLILEIASGAFAGKEIKQRLFIKGNEYSSTFENKKAISKLLNNMGIDVNIEDFHSSTGFMQAINGKDWSGKYQDNMYSDRELLDDELDGYDIRNLTSVIRYNFYITVTDKGYYDCKYLGRKEY